MESDIKILSSTIDNQLKIWNYTYNIGIPLVPNINIKCPICGSDIRFKHYNIHHRKYIVTGDKYRIDMSYKCTNCAYILTFGVAVEKEYYYTIYNGLNDLLGRVRSLHILEYIDIINGR